MLLGFYYNHIGDVPFSKNCVMKSYFITKLMWSKDNSLQMITLRGLQFYGMLRNWIYKSDFIQLNWPFVRFLFFPTFFQCLSINWPRRLLKCNHKWKVIVQEHYFDWLDLKLTCHIWCCYTSYITCLKKMLLFLFK